MNLEAQPWWTEADASELRLLCFEFSRVAYVHLDGCAVCSERGPWCPALRAAFDEVLAWRQGRIIRSKANWLRERQDFWMAA